MTSFLSVSLKYALRANTNADGVLNSIAEFMSCRSYESLSCPLIENTFSEFPPVLKVILSDDSVV